jgi:hypothetical protein
MTKLYLFIAGAVAFAACQIIWLTFFKFSSSNWVLEPTPGVLMCSMVMILTGSVCTYIFHARLRNLIFFIAGACVSLTLMLFIVGPGNLWPIVLVIDYLMMTALTVIGWLIGVLFLNKKKKNNIIETKNA